MAKKSLVILAIAFCITTSTAMADTIIQQTQSPIYTDDIGRAHFLGRGGYSTVRTLQMGEAHSAAVNEVANETKRIEKKVEEQRNATPETDITKVIKERENVPVSSRTKASFTTQDRTMDPSASFGQGSTYIQSSGVNESKTMYKDDIGRLHFFGKGNIIKE